MKQFGFFCRCLIRRSRRRDGGGVTTLLGESPAVNRLPEEEADKVPQRHPGIAGIPWRLRGTGRGHRHRGGSTKGPPPLGRPHGSPLTERIHVSEHYSLGRSQPGMYEPRLGCQTPQAHVSCPPAGEGSSMRGSMPASITSRRDFTIGLRGKWHLPSCR